MQAPLIASLATDTYASMNEMLKEILTVAGANIVMPGGLLDHVRRSGGTLARLLEVRTSLYILQIDDLHIYRLPI